MIILPIAPNSKPNSPKNSSKLMNGRANIGAPKNGEILFDGKGESLCTIKDYGDFKMPATGKFRHAATAAFMCAAVRKYSNTLAAELRRRARNSCR